MAVREALECSENSEDMVWLKSKLHWEIQKEPVVGGWDSEARQPGLLCLLGHLVFLLGPIFCISEPFSHPQTLITQNGVNKTTVSREPLDPRPPPSLQPCSSTDFVLSFP
ncbi:Sodium Channel Protein Type 4 Subunit Alpha [Manis pentadactyla]|nr:Sodium Channel Protein Type 4 Subunit Alpha [Manis pentadactyla]